jgi:hypothetical protein
MEPWQTRATEFHPYMVESVAALPQTLRAAAQAALPAGALDVRAFVVPADYRSVGDEEPHPVPEQALVFTEGDTLHVQAGLDGQSVPAYKWIRPDTLLYLRSSHLLLYGRLELLGSDQGEPVQLDMEFNAIGWHLMELEWHSLVGKAIGVPPPVPGEERAESQQELTLLATLPPKFAEGLRKYGLYTGEILQGVVFQPAIWTQTLALFENQVMPNTLLALTEASVLVLEEEPALVRKSEQIGLIITRIPRQAVADVQSAARGSIEEITFLLARSGATAEQRVLLEPASVRLWRELGDKRSPPG